MTLSNRVKDLLDRAFKEHYRISSPCRAEVVVTVATDFDLDDGQVVSVLPIGSGKFSFHGTVSDDVAIAAYDHFVNQCVAPPSFLRGRMKCDYLLIREGVQGLSLLLEITSGLGSSAALHTPILDNRKEQVRYPGGKYEKVEDQLSHSLQDLLSVPEISAFLMTQPNRICLMSYKIIPHTDSDYLMKHPFERYLLVESEETKDNGAVISCTAIEDQGFEFRRICHPYVFSV